MTQTQTQTQTSSPTYQIVNPATGEVEQTFDTATDAEIEGALAAAHTAYAAWKDVPIEDRAKVVTRIAELFVERQAELGAIATKEMGKPLSEAVGEAEFCGDIFSYFATEGPTLAADQPIKTFSGGKAVVQKLPIGTILGIMPWNYPFYQIARFAAPNLMLGNTVILKHAESVPGSALAVAQLMKDAGVPDGAYVNVFASHDQIETMIADPRVAGVSLTGSERAGAVVASIAGKNLKKCVLELGGSDPYVILDSDDVAGAADTAWETRISNTGQACNSNKRMIVMDDVFDGFVARLTEHAKDLRPGDPTAEEDGTFAPLSSRAAAENAGRAGAGRRQQGRHAARRRRARRRPGGVLLAGRAHRHHRGHAGLPRGALRPGRRGLQGLQRRRGPRAGQRHGVRARRRGVQHRHRACDQGRPAPRGRDVQREHARPARAPRCRSVA